METIITWAISGGIFIIALASFWLGVSDRISKVAQEANREINVLRTEREQAGERIGTQINVMQASFHLYREQQAKEQREFITREMLRDFEARIERSMRESAERAVEAINQLTARLDRLIGDRTRERD
jgi:hypothetical protein